jgi:DNA-binding transcriptional regulator YiaG
MTVVLSSSRFTGKIDMSIATISAWRPGTDLRHVIPVGDDHVLAVVLPAKWLAADRSGEPVFLPPAVRLIDRLRAFFKRPVSVTPGFIVSLREALGLTQEEFAKKLGVSKMTVSRWECGRMRPSRDVSERILKLQQQAQRDGTLVSGEKRISAPH